MEQIILEPDQSDDFARTIEITNRHPLVLNTSATGSGKTISVIHFLKEKNIKRAIVICNNSVQVDHWTKFSEKYNSSIVMIISYDTLRGSKTITAHDGREMVSHGLLYKDHEGNFYPSEIYMLWVEEGLVLIADECHSIKNDRAKTDAFKALSRYITLRSLSLPYPVNKSWTYCLSMTPFDKPEHCVNFAFTCGIIRSNELYSKSNDCPTGILELYQYCKYYNPERTDAIWGLYDIKNSNVAEVAYKLISEVFLRLISTFTKNSQIGYKSKQSIYYSYSDIPHEAHIMMKKALEMIKAPVKSSNQSLQILSNLENTQKTQEQLEMDYITQVFSNITMGENINERSGVIQGTITCQTIKTYYILVPLIHYVLCNVPNVKIIVFLDYKESINIIMRMLAMYSPVKITGDAECTKERRREIINKFNEPNLELRLLAIISQIGSDSIELDDRNGNFPRVSFGLPDFYYSRFFQCPGRTFRRYSETNSLFFWCLVNTEEYSEESVFKSTSEKSAVMEETLQNNEIIPPIYFQKIVNPHMYDMNYLLSIAGSFKVNRERTENKRIKNVVQVSQVTFTKRL